MGINKKIMGQKELQKKVLETGLCTHCGACVNLCPYAVSYKDHTILLDPCGREEGRCYAFCPRTPTDLQTLRQRYDPHDLTPELGAVRGFHLTRAAEDKVRQSSQHGGTVTTLVSLALEEGIIDTAILAEEGAGFLPEGIAVHRVSDVKKRGKSRFVVSPNLAAFHKAAKSSSQKIGVVATPCQAVALAKMQQKPYPSKDSNIDKLRLVIGLFCGWALSWRELKAFLEKRFGNNSILGLDIPPSKHNSMEIHTPGGIVEIPLDEVIPFVRKSCGYCWDMTAEFSDLSVGSARLPEGWAVARGWNQVIVRTAAGQELLELARSRKVLEFREMPEGNLERLKKASLNKKRAALQNLAQMSGNPEDLLYLDSQDPVLRTLIS
ncbi:MAG TPA: Coenzyme F420 hydrogenase/dehydrogenase, beta subunit C-terminal domain [Thermodesulfobacteriota bacterium]|nr:Coenzyme F420 hydrogenase/dehydrogenase, beta subunit C-terminal domain [Thermodesulfobacteriota bacterium]